MIRDEIVVLLRKTASRFWTADLWFARLAVGLGSLLWGVLLLSEAGILSMRRPVLETMASVIPIRAWGAAFLLCGCLQLGRAVSGVPESYGWYSVLIAALILMLWWGVIFTVIIATGLFSPGVMAANISITFLATVIFVRTFVRMN